MDVFGIREKLVKDYADYVRSFIRISDDDIRNHVDASLEKGLLWPDPLVQLNPSFEPGEFIDQLVEQDVLHHECRPIFRTNKDQQPQGKPLRLHRHQSDAIKAAKTGDNYILTTGTGSGKSLAYIVPIVDHVLRAGSGKGIQAIIVYPMNALCNSQYGELEKFLCYGYPDGKPPVRFARYTGQESDELRRDIIANPPDILLTNYVMLELILTRPDEKKGIVKAAQGLRFLVLDELHTYRGRQGADVALLVRRVRDACNAKQLQCIGTSATLAGPGTYEEQRQEIADVATRLFGDHVKAEMVIGETLRKATPETDLADDGFLIQLRKRVSDENTTPPEDYDSFVQDPLSIWIENILGITAEPESGRLVRTKPRPITGATGVAQELSTLTGVQEIQCSTAIEQGLMAGYRCENPETGFPAFAFRLHQFVSRGDMVYASIEQKNRRHITVHGQQFVPGDRERSLLPLVFCRECGQEYYCVRAAHDAQTGSRVFLPRELNDRLTDGTSEAGFLYLNSESPWPLDPEEVIQKVPEDWLEEHNGSLRIRRDRRKDVPQYTPVNTIGIEEDGGIECSYVKAPFRFCLQCGVSYGHRQASDFAKLTPLGTEGRSTATTIMSLSVVRNLRLENTLPEKAKKLLSFTDNRQDASLQAGHFNDFVEVGLLRAALYRAVSDAGANGLRHDELTQRVFDAIELPFSFYASNPEAKLQAKMETERTFRKVLGYRIYRDLRRGWRVVSPNLEQCGLLEIEYLSLDELCRSEEYWQGFHSALINAKPEERFKIAKTLLDYMRRELAIKVDFLDSYEQEKMQQASNQWLEGAWAIDDNERMEYAPVLFPRSRGKGEFAGYVYLSPRGGFGQYLRRRQSTFPQYTEKITMEESREIILQLLRVLTVAGIMTQVIEPRDNDDVPGYQMQAATMLWKAGNGTKAFHDPINIPNESTIGGHTNPFFIDFYMSIALDTKGMESREHTAQVTVEERIDRETRFREGQLPILYCSPTMELGVDISELNVVNLRNIPPTPANYAQRSGRAGRSGQPALVFSYCSTGSPHDQYFFKHPELMVSGSVTPPRLDLANEDLVRAHMHAIWLAETSQGLGSTLADILNVSGDQPTLELLDSVKAYIGDANAAERARNRARHVLSTIKNELEDSDWYSPGWLDEALSHTVMDFDRTCDRWRSLYQAALDQAVAQTKIIHDASRSHQDKTMAERLRREAEAQLKLLTESANVAQSDFYSYRYFASEGFLPGYNFPRLPLSAYIPGRQHKKGRDEFLSRSRFLAISEFGPRAVLYHEGSRYLINKVILPVEQEDVLITSVKQCTSCGYLHPEKEGNPDLCERCGVSLDTIYSQLFRLQNVSTKRRERINSDEEERVRLGYDIKTGFRFARVDGHLSCRVALVKNGEGHYLAKLTYGHAATLHRINLGWARRKNKEQLGFVLDFERGYWARNEQETEGDADDPMSPNTRRIIPYVEDRRNCLLFEPQDSLSETAIASLQAALKTAIQVQYQLEDNELAAEPLPDPDERRMILFYESAEGGAGVLRRLIDDSNAWASVARTALQLCHFDPDTGNDLHKATVATEDCEAACYDCLMSYRNQRDHRLLDRQAIKDILLSFVATEVHASPTALPRSEQLKRLMNLAGSELEQGWLNFLEENNLNLPSEAQVFIQACNTRPDFLYKSHATAIYIDGPPHDFPDRAERDTQRRECLEDLGYTIIRFGHQEDWADKISKYPNIFGSLS
ncbi:MAG: DEAD/DEAH box helicase [Planctomycetes bacterium]|nr:DEAD/DEAH box helicase [Planctomycetota bacterium]